MNSQTATTRIPGPVGELELAMDLPAHAPVGTAVIAHPHPLFGGTLHNKVVQTLARACVQAGWRTVRFNFRGVGGSAGEHAQGVGEVDDLLAVIKAEAANGPLVLAGFSFGAMVTARALVALHQQPGPPDQPDSTERLHRLMLVGTAASRFDVPAVPAHLHGRTLVVHGEVDDTVPLAFVMDWARPQHLPVTVVPGVEHFFHGQLPLLKSLALRHLGG